MNKIDLFFQETKRLNDIINNAKQQLPKNISLKIDGRPIVSIQDSGNILLCEKYNIDAIEAITIAHFLIDITTDITENNNVNIR